MRHFQGFILIFTKRGRSFSRWYQDVKISPRRECFHNMFWHNMYNNFELGGAIKRLSYNHNIDFLDKPVTLETCLMIWIVFTVDTP